MAKLHDPFGVIAKQRQLARDLVDAVRASDVERFADALDALDLRCPQYAQKRTSGLAFSTSAL